ncbi:hypothetical protein GCM10027594_22000 [Hymenobacter agri]
MHFLAKPAWPGILLGLMLTTAGWLRKLIGYRYADACIVAGTGLMLLFGALVLWKLSGRLNIGLRGPLIILAGGLMVSLLAASDAPIATSGLAVIGGMLAAGGTAWLLARLNCTLRRSGQASRTDLLH